MFKMTVAILALVSLLSGCSQSGVRNSKDPLAFLAAGAEIQLTRDLEVPAGETRVFFQRGSVTSRGGLDYYHPSCDLEVWELQQKTRNISTDIFVIGKLTSGREHVVSRGGLKLADNRLAAKLFGDDGSSVHRYLRVEMHSTLQPDVMRLTCRGAWEDYHTARLPNEMEIKLALGEILVIL
ncbi:MAG: hypothetical protein GY792_34210 [Gammaproteobacteria bacterium]|nr:hypothetical protein [Gammaproteobacteria bacterium]